MKQEAFPQGFGNMYSHKFREPFIPTGLWEHLIQLNLFPQILGEQLFPQVCQNSILFKGKSYLTGGVPLTKNLFDGTPSTLSNSEPLIGQQIFVCHCSR